MQGQHTSEECEAADGVAEEHVALKVVHVQDILCPAPQSVSCKAAFAMRRHMAAQRPACPSHREHQREVGPRQVDVLLQQDRVPG